MNTSSNGDAGAFLGLDIGGQNVEAYVYEAASEGVRFEAALLGPEAGLLGAALYGASTILSREEFLGLAHLAMAAINT